MRKTPSREPPAAGAWSSEVAPDVQSKMGLESSCAQANIVILKGDGRKGNIEFVLVRFLKIAWLSQATD